MPHLPLSSISTETLPSPASAREHSSEGLISARRHRQKPLWMSAPAEAWQLPLHRPPARHCSLHDRDRNRFQRSADPSVGRNHFRRKADPSVAQSLEERHTPAVAAAAVAADVHSGRYRSVLHRRCRSLTSFGAAQMAERSWMAVNAK